MTLDQLPRPPYARLAQTRLSAPMIGRVPSFGELTVFTGENAWDAVKITGLSAVVLPPDQFPEEFDWSIASLTRPPYYSCMVINSRPGGASNDVLARLGRCLILGGARHVCILPRHSPPAFFKARTA